MQEFLVELQKSLTNKLSAAEVMQHVNYYREYIEVEVRKGRSEQEVIAELGNPRLIAKSILQAASNKAGSQSIGSGKDGADGRDGRSFGEFLLSLPDWVKLLLIILVVIAIASLFISVLRIFLPVLIPLIAIFILVKWWNSNK